MSLTDFIACLDIPLPNILIMPNPSLRKLLRNLPV